MRIGGTKVRVLTAILSGYCNTSQDVADETGLTVKACSKCIHALVGDGAVTWTDRFIPIRNYRLRVFEVAA